MIGGVVSVFIKILMFSYVILLTKQLIFYEKDENSTVTTVVEMKDLPNVRYNETYY